MKWIKYQLCNRVNIGTEEEPEWHESFVGVRLPYTEKTVRLAEKEAYNGEYEIVDDGEPEPEPVPSDAERIADLEEALEMILSGVTE